MMPPMPPNGTFPGFPPRPNITLPFPKPPQLQAALLFQEAATASVAALGASAGLLGSASPALATAASRSGVISKLASCEPSLDEALPASVSPTGLELDLGAADVRYHVGALVGNMAILLGFTLLCFVYAVIHTKFRAKPEERRVFGVAYRSFGAARFPSGIMFFFMYFYQPFISSSLIAIFYGNTESGVLAILVMLFSIGCLGLLALIVRDDKNFLATYRTREEVEFDEQFSIKERKLKGLPEEEEEPQGSCEKFDKWYERVVEGVSGFWFDVPRPDEELDFATREKIDMKRIQNHEGHKYFQLRFGGAFDYYQSRFRWFIILEVLACIAFGICDALIDLISCDIVGYILIAFFALYVGIVFVLRPYASRKDLVFSGLISLLQLIAGILALLPDGTIVDDDTQEAVIITVGTVSLVVGTVQAVEGIICDILRFAADKLSDDEEAPVNYNLVAAGAVVLHERHDKDADDKSPPSSINDKQVALAENRQASGEIIPLSGSKFPSPSENNNNNEKSSQQSQQPHRQAASTTLPHNVSPKVADTPLAAGQKKHKTAAEGNGDDADEFLLELELQAPPPGGAVGKNNFNNDEDMDLL